MATTLRWGGRRLLPIVVATVIGLVVPGASEAVSGATAACVTTITWTFSPPLIHEARSGSIVQQAAGYTGNCQIALVTVNGVPFLLLGGSVVLSAVANPPADMWLAAAILTPNEVCNQSSASGVSTSAFTLIVETGSSTMNKREL